MSRMWQETKHLITDEFIKKFGTYMHWNIYSTIKNKKCNFLQPECK